MESAQNDCSDRCIVANGCQLWEPVNAIFAILVSCEFKTIVIEFVIFCVKFN